MPKVDPSDRAEAWRLHRSESPVTVPSVLRPRQIQPRTAIDPAAHDRKIDELVERFTEHRELNESNR